MRKSVSALLFAVSFSICSLPLCAEESSKESARPVIAEATVDSVSIGGGMLITTTDTLEAYKIREYRGIVRGVMVREPNSIQSFKAGIQGMFGGKINAYIHNCETGRQAAYDAMVQQAQARGANGIVGVRYDSDSFQGNGNDFGTEIVCYGTAVILDQVKAP